MLIDILQTTQQVKEQVEEILETQPENIGVSEVPSISELVTVITDIFVTISDGTTTKETSELEITLEDQQLE